MASTRRRQPAPPATNPPSRTTTPAARPVRRAYRWPGYRFWVAFLMGCWAERLGLYIFGFRIPNIADIALLAVTCVLAGFVYLAAARLRNELSKR